MSLWFGNYLLVLVCLVNLHGSSKINAFDDSKKSVHEFNRNFLENNSSKYVKKTVHFWMYPSKQPDKRLMISPHDLDSARPFFDGDQSTKILIHGWLGNGKDQTSVCTTLKTEYFKLNGYYNVICVDWSLIVLDSTYLAARWRCKEIGNYVAELIAALLDKTNLKLDSVHIIGFSMGAHIAGYAGKNFNGQIPRITGLDPAKPLFYMGWPQTRLSKDDAQFVDVLHTTVRLLGQSKPLGDVDFYPNGGNPIQPGCGEKIVVGDNCSHFLAYQYYGQSIQNKDNFLAVKCDGWKQFERSDCDDNFAFMGEYASSNSIPGKYYLSVPNLDKSTVF